MLSGVFGIELLLKVISYGLMCNGKSSYLRSAWNILDAAIVIVSIISITLDFVSGNSQNKLEELKKLKILRILRVLRPLRLVTRNEGLKLALNSLFAAIPGILNLLVVCLMFFLLFGIFGVNYFKGGFYYCNLQNIYIDFKGLIETKADCLDYGGDWINRDANFDNVLSATSTLFQLATTEGWIEIMFNGIDSAGIDVQPVPGLKKFWALFFIAFMIVGSFFILNLFAGVVVDTFQIEKDRLGGIAFLTKEQQEWINMQLSIVKLKPEKMVSNLS